MTPFTLNRGSMYDDPPPLAHRSKYGGGVSRGQLFKNLPTIAVREPASCSRRGNRVVRSRGRTEPFPHTLVLCAYRPVRIVARDGQQRGVTANAFGYRTPRRWRYRLVLLITHIVLA